MGRLLPIASNGSTTTATMNQIIANGRQKKSNVRINVLIRSILLALTVLFCASFASAQTGSLYQNIVFRYTPAGAFPASGATITICTASATGQPCAPTVTVYSDAALSNAVANPLPVCSTSPQFGCEDGLGNFSFYIAQGSYTYTVTGSGLNPYGPIPFGTSCVAGVTCVSASANNNFIGFNTFANGTPNPAMKPMLSDSVQYVSKN